MKSGDGIPGTMGILGQSTFRLCFMACVISVWMIGCDAAIDRDGKYCEGLDCMSQAELISMIEHLRKDMQNLRGPGFTSLIEVDMTSVKKNLDITSLATVSETCVNLNGSNKHDYLTKNCNVCHKRPCLMGGTCLVKDPNNQHEGFYCLCANNYRGLHCEFEVKCEEDSCPSGNNCSVNAGQHVCTPNQAKTIDGVRVEKTCFGNGAVNTFDGLKLNTFGTCPFVLSNTCKTLAKGTPGYNLVVSSFGKEISSTTFATFAELSIFGRVISFSGLTKTISMNGLTIDLPYSWPKSSDPKIRITTSGGEIQIQTKEKLTLTLRDDSFCLEVPVEQYKGKVCGMAGNMDEKEDNDLRFKNGTLTTKEALDKANQTIGKVIESWQEEFVHLENRNCTTETREHTICPRGMLECLSIVKAKTGDGVFGMCSVMGEDEIDSFYRGCLNVVCGEDLESGKTIEKCHFAKLFQSACQEQLEPNTDMGDWREKLNCPMKCLPNAHYETCKSSCPVTCADPNRLKCFKGCSEGCICDVGYLQDPTVRDQVKCISEDQCGCFDQNGNPHPNKQEYFEANCTISNECVEQRMITKSHKCPANAHCSSTGQTLQCHCDPGYQMTDNGTCEDYNECEKPKTCNQHKNHGTCENTIGSYKCHCNEFFYGDECELYGPRRHCADLQEFYGITKSGYYDVNWDSKGYSATVYCDMDTAGGGWTLMSSAEGAEFANVTYAQYQKPFGGKGKSVDWLGLDNIAAMTQGEETSLRVDIHRCEEGEEDRDFMLTYANFLVNSADKQYSVNIPYKATTNETIRRAEAWLLWDKRKDGPVFSTFDKDKDGCSNEAGRTGFWFYHTGMGCRVTNLNGVRGECAESNLHDEKLLVLHDENIQQSSLWLRPRNYTGMIATPSQNGNEKISTTISTTTPRPSTPPRNSTITPERTTPEEPTTKTPPAKTNTPTVGPTTKTHPTRTFTAPTTRTKGTGPPVGQTIKKTPVKATGNDAPTTGKRGGRKTTAKKVPMTTNHEQPITKTLPTRPSKERLNPTGTPGKETERSAGETTRRATVILYPRDGVTLI